MALQARRTSLRGSSAGSRGAGSGHTAVQWRAVPSTHCCRRRVAAVAALTPDEELRKLEADRISLRSEAEAPFRPLRLVLYGFSVASAGVATLISLPQLAGALGGAPSALPLEDVLTNLGIDLGAVGLFAWLFSLDWAARERQIARLGRESALAALSVQLSSGRRVRLEDLQGFARVVLLAGTTEQVAAALAAAAPLRESLQARGVLVVPLPIYGGVSDGAPLPPPGPDEQRWRVTPLQPDAWREWFSKQLALTRRATPEGGLYVGLRLDGRVRASGMGAPPWERFVAELAPVEGKGAWTGLMSGFDGKV